jgi:hypothetical protein
MDNAVRRSMLSVSKEDVLKAERDLKPAHHPEKKRAKKKPPETRIIIQVASST